MKRICAVLFFLVLSSAFCRAQWVTIPDPKFAALLKNYYPSCMNGNQLDTTCSGIVNATDVYWTRSQSINDLTGIQYFDKLKTLDCSQNPFTFLPNLPASLITLTCRTTSLASWPSLPPNLVTLFCDQGKFTSLPALPATLTTLYCVDNKLTSLPSLPPALFELACTFNNLTSLPALPSSLKVMAVGHNAISVLPSLPSSLTILSCEYNQLQQLPSIPASLIKLLCYGNLLTGLPTLPATLEVLNCNSNQITNLALSPTKNLDCSSNNLVSLPAFPATLEVIECSKNKITVLPALPDSLWEIYCSDNKLTSLPALPAKLNRLNCWNNSITTIPPLPVNLTYLFCYNNQLTSIQGLPPAIKAFRVYNNPGLTCLPPGLLQFTGSASDFNISGTSITCLPNVIQHSGSIPAIDTMAICNLCGVPSFLIKGITTNSAAVEWIHQDCIYNYQVRYRVKGTATWSVILAYNPATFKFIKGLTPATEYEVRMRAACSSSTFSNWSGSQFFTTLATCDVPAGVTSTKLKKDRAVITWNTVAGAYSYKVRYRKQGTTPWSNRVILAPTTVKVLTALTPNTPYEYQVETICNASGTLVSAWSSIQTFTTLLRLEDEGEKALMFSVYPNPAGEQLTVSSNRLTLSSKLTITDLLGRTILSQSANSNYTIIDVSHLAKGVYILTLYSDDGNEVRKFVKD